MLKFNLNIADRKLLVKRLEALVGTNSTYTRAPFYAYKIGDYIVDHDGNLFIDETVADVEILSAVMNEGVICGGEIMPDVEEDAYLSGDTDNSCAKDRRIYATHNDKENTCTASFSRNESDLKPNVIEVNLNYSKIMSEPKSTQAEQAEEAEEVPLDIDIPYPLDKHNGWTLRNLMNLFYSRASLINKATGSHFHVSKEFIEALKDDYCTYTIANFRKVLSDYEKKHGEAGYEGLKITKNQVLFSGFATAPDVEHLTAYGQLIVLMNYQAISQRRILAKVVDETNEKYAMRTWMIRLGMNGDDFKATRKILLKNLNGVTSCRTVEQAEAAKKRALEKRHAERPKEIISQDEEQF